MERRLIVRWGDLLTELLHIPHYRIDSPAEPRPDAKETRPSGHVQVVERASGRRSHALWRYADGRHQRVPGPAWVKDSGKRTPRGAVVWRAANVRKPDPSHLSPAEAEDLLRQLLASAPRRPTRARPGTGTRFMDVAEDWMIHGERKRGLKSGTLRDYGYTLRTHLLPAFGDQEIEAITREGIRASLVQVEGWMGHSHIQTTARYLHHRAQTSDAALLAEAFRSIHPEAAPAAQPRTHARLASPSPRAS